MGNLEGNQAGLIKTPSQLAGRGGKGCINSAIASKLGAICICTQKHFILKAKNSFLKRSIAECMFKLESPIWSILFIAESMFKFSQYIL